MYVLPTQCIYVLCMDLRTNSDFVSLYSINWFVFMTETECVYCVVRTGYLNLIQVNSPLEGNLNRGISVKIACV